MTIEFARYSERVRHLFDELSELHADFPLTIDEERAHQVRAAQERFFSEAKLRLSFVGEFSAGKSSIISGLTGEKLHIDADVATDCIAEHEWKSVILVDTPGVQAEAKDTTHDEITRRALVEADLVLFVITTELFNDRLADFLHLLLDDDSSKFSQKLCVVINKTDREDNPKEVIRAEVRKVLGAYTEVPIVLCSAKKWLQSRSLSGERRERFVAQSGWRELTDGIDTFVSDAGYHARLMTPLTVIQNALEEMQILLSTNERDGAQIEAIRRQRRWMAELEKDFRKLSRKQKYKVRSVLIDEANDKVEGVTENSSADDIVTLYTRGMNDAMVGINSQMEEVRDAISDLIVRARSELENEGVPVQTESGSEQIEFDHDWQSRGPSVDDVKGKSSGIMSAFMKKMDGMVEEPLKKLGDPKVARDVYYKSLKKFGKNFKPWEAVKGGRKIAKVAGKAGKAIPIISAGLEWYLNHREEKAEMELQKRLASARMNLRAAFLDEADQQAEVMQSFIHSHTRPLMNTTSDYLNGLESSILSERQEHSELNERIRQLKNRCNSLQEHLVWGDEETEE